jgi:predicted HicB family RNase H-like nuclease
LVKAFRESIDDYLAFCAERGEAPDKPYSGRFLVRTSPELHRQLVNKALHSDVSLNQLVVDVLAAGVATAGQTSVR